MKRTLIFSAFVLLTVGCAQKPDWTEKELDIINGQDPVMRVLTIAVPEDSLTLRLPSSDFSLEDLQTGTYAALEAKMISTVTSPEQDGVGIAGPQVGILRRIVAVQRFDKDGEPFEVYPNVRITAYRGETEPGPEGCLSVPDMRGDVMRYRDIDISYTSPSSLQDTTETVKGYTAIIFQHECDHLDGILYTDRLCETSE